MVILMNIDISKNQYLNKLDNKKPIVCAVSGGVDSMVLLDLLLHNGFSVIIAHVNHHMREQSLIEENYLREYAAKHNLQIYVYDYYHSDDNFQASAHDKRYAFFYQIYQEKKASAIITAHHANDNLETILMNITRGSNLYGYAGISEINYYQDALIIRPLIETKKDDLYLYAKLHNVVFFEDSSNAENDYLRNRIRHNVIPFLKDENPQLEKSITNYSKQLLAAFAYIRKQSMRYWQQNQKIILDDFNQMDNILKSDLINYLFEINNIASSTNKITDVISVLSNKTPNLTYDLSDCYQLIKNYQEAYIQKKKSPLNFSVLLDKNTIAKTPKGNFYLSNEKSEKAFKIAKNEAFPLTIRTRLAGDSLIIRDGHKKLKDFCIDKKIPLQKRNELIIVTNALNEIIWVVDYYQKKYDEQEQIYLNYEESKNE